MVELSNLKLTFFEHLLGVLQVTFATYMDIFLLYLVCRFAKENKNVEARDPILRKRVPNIVFLQNQKLLAEAMRGQLEYNEEVKEELVARAQFNEYFYDLLRSEEVASPLDETIGVEFVNARTFSYASEPRTYAAHEEDNMVNSSGIFYDGSLQTER